MASSGEFDGEGVTSRSIRESSNCINVSNELDIFHVDGIGPAQRTWGRFFTRDISESEASPERLITTESSGIWSIISIPMERSSFSNSNKS